MAYIKKEETQLLKRLKIPELSNKIPDTRKSFGFFLEMEDYLDFIQHKPLILELRKMRSKDIWWLIQGHKADEWYSTAQGADFLTPISCC